MVRWDGGGECRRYSTLLKLDLATHKVTAAWAVPGLVAPTGIATKGDELYIIGSGGTVWVVARQ